jgi:DNA-binding MarR family transcriptional regulator
MYPHEFRLLWELKSYGPQIASEIADGLNLVDRPGRSPQTIGNQMRGHVARGFVVGDGQRPQTYRLTDRGREYVDA